MMYTMPKTLVVTSDICPECFGQASCTHGALQDNGNFVHEYDCDECGSSVAIVGYDCPECQLAVQP